MSPILADVAIFNHNVYDNIRTRVVVVSRGRILLEPPPDDTQGWTCPGGGLEPDESLTDCAKREVLEETGIDVVIEGVAFLREWVVPRYASSKVDDFVTVVHGDHATNEHGFGLEVFFYAKPKLLTAEPRPEHDRPNFQWIPLIQVQEMPVWPAELKWLCRRLAEGKTTPGVPSFVTDLASPWFDLPADPFADLES